MQFMVQDVPASVVEFLDIYAPHLASLHAGVQSIKVYVIPGLVLFGTLGNLLTIQMFKDVSLRSVPVVPYVKYSMCSLAVSTQDSPAVEPRSNPGSGKILMSENLRLYTTSPVVMC